MGVFTKRPESLTNDFFVNPARYAPPSGKSFHSPNGSAGVVLKGRDRKTGELRWTGSRVDLVFGSKLATSARWARSLPPVPMWRRSLLNGLCRGLEQG